MSQKKTVCIDFDGVIHRYSQGWKDGSIYDDPMPGVQEALKSLVDRNYTVIILTSRDNHQEIMKWTYKHGMEIGKFYHAITNTKVPAIAYIDDRGIRFTNWNETLEEFARHYESKQNDI